MLMVLYDAHPAVDAYSAVAKICAGFSLLRPDPVGNDGSEQALLLRAQPSNTKNSRGGIAVDSLSYAM